MNIRLHEGPLAELETDALAWPLANGSSLGQAADQQVAALRESGEVRGKPSELTLLHEPKGLQSRRLMLLGVGDSLDATQAFRMAGQAVRAAQKRRFKRLAIALPDGDLVRAATEGCVYGSYEQPKYKSDDSNPPLEEILIVAPSADSAAFDAGRIVGESVNLTRRLVDTPANDLGPVEFAEMAESMGKAAGLEVEVLDESALEALGAGSLLSVARGSARPPRLVRLAWNPSDVPGDSHLFLVGKGVTFDTGGLSLKPAKSMEKMKYDMAGAATMLGAITAIARLGIRQRVSCLLGLVENMPSGSATRPGDIVQAMNGKTIEVINTDAEGRLVLADALTHAVRLGATHLIDAATLTGAVSVALGSVNIGLLGNDNSLSDYLKAIGRTIGEHFWPLPMNDEYLEPMKGDLSDLRNAGNDRKAGTITAAKFLEQFVDGTPWVHLDIAGTANLDKGLPNAPKGASGIAVRTLVRAVENWPRKGAE
jgi:leucyl aminopeptidase